MSSWHNSPTSHFFNIFFKIKTVSSAVKCEFLGLSYVAVIDVTINSKTLRPFFRLFVILSTSDSPDSVESNMAPVWRPIMYIDETAHCCF